MTLNTTHRAVVHGQVVEVEILEIRPAWFRREYRVAYEHTYVNPTNKENNYTVFAVEWIKERNLLGKLE